MSEQETIVYKDYLGGIIREHLSGIAREYIGAPTDIPTGTFWFRKGNIHKLDEIQKFSKHFIEPLLDKECFLIGDTAFMLNHPPHDIHIDCPNLKDGIKGYKSVVIPLEIDTDNYPMLYTAEQYYYGPTTRFRAGCEDLDNNQGVENQKANGVHFSYDYEADGVKHLSNSITEEWYNNHIDEHVYVPYSSFRGISIEKANEWKPSSVIIFDSSRIHFAEKIQKVGATYKIGISLNYGVKA